jgi:hypothetical protein
MMIAAANTASAPHASHSAAGDTPKSLMPICGAKINAADHVTAYAPM